MSALDHIIAKDRVWTALSSTLMGRTRPMRGGVAKLCCPMCVLRGETPDTRYRCGLYNDSEGIGVHCFNCGFRCRYKPGDALSRTMLSFMDQLGVPSEEQQRASQWALTLRDLSADSPDGFLTPLATALDYPQASLPPGAQSLAAWAEQGCDDADFGDTAAYLFTRGDELADPQAFYWSPDRQHDVHRRLLIPAWHESRLVGWIGRAISPDITPRYYNAVPPDLLLNTRALSIATRKFVICTEGGLDCLAIDGVGLLGAKLTERQAGWLNAIDKVKIVLPDRDRSGARLIDAALMHGWHVAFPYSALGEQWWDRTVKDAAEAAQSYGKLYTIRSILASATRDPLLIEAHRSAYI